MTGVLQKTVDRAGFFRWGTESLKRLAGEVIDPILEGFREDDMVKWRGTSWLKYRVNGGNIYVFGGSCTGCES